MSGTGEEIERVGAGAQWRHPVRTSLGTALKARVEAAVQDPDTALAGGWVLNLNAPHCSLSRQGNKHPQTVHYGCKGAALVLCCLPLSEGRETCLGPEGDRLFGEGNRSELVTPPRQGRESWTPHAKPLFPDLACHDSEKMVIFASPVKEEVRGCLRLEVPGLGAPLLQSCEAGVG